MTEPRWFAVMTLPRAEEQAVVNLRRQGYWTFYPHSREKIRVGRHKRIREVNRPLLSRYIFVCLRHENEAIGPVNDTVGVARVVCRRMSGEPLRIPNPVMDELMQRADDGGLVLSTKPPHWFKGKPGDAVRMADDAPYFGLITRIASIEGLDKHSELRIWLTLFGAEREVPVPATAVAEVLTKDAA